MTQFPRQLQGALELRLRFDWIACEPHRYSVNRVSTHPWIVSSVGVRQRMMTGWLVHLHANARVLQNFIKFPQHET